jgi:hypothetical protein
LAGHIGPTLAEPADSIATRSLQLRLRKDCDSFAMVPGSGKIMPRRRAPLIGSGIFSLALVLLAACAPRPESLPPQSAGEQCLAALDQRGVRYEIAAIKVTSSPCSVSNPVRVTAAGIAWSQPGLVNCNFALRLDDFAETVIQPLAHAYFGQGAVRLDHYGTFSCRSAKSASRRPQWSQHATGNAIDVAGIQLADGTLIKVERDWHDPGPRGQFLRRLARSACDHFSQVLTPDSNLEHYNHIHLDDGPYRRCEI